MARFSIGHLRQQFLYMKSTYGMQALTTPDDDPSAIRIDDEACLLSEMCAKLATVPNQTVPVFEFKKFYGLQNVTGHRLWRKLRTKLLKNGSVEFYDGYLHVSSYLPKDFLASTLYLIIQQRCPAGFWVVDAGALMLLDVKWLHVACVTILSVPFAGSSVVRHAHLFTRGRRFIVDA